MQGGKNYYGCAVRSQSRRSGAYLFCFSTPSGVYRLNNNRKQKFSQPGKIVLWILSSCDKMRNLSAVVFQILT